MSSPAEVESFSYDDRIVRQFVTATLLWGVLACLVGVVAGGLLLLPTLLPGAPEWLSFGRIRPSHTNTALFAFLANGLFAAVYYSTQRLCKARMWSGLLSQLHFWGWQAVIAGAAITIPLGMTQGREYAEAQWPIDIGIAAIWFLAFGLNFAMTVAKRREKYTYVSLWFYTATIITFGLVHVINNLVVPLNWQQSYGWFAGVQDALVQWWYGHNAIAFLMSMPFLGLMYCFLPKIAERPLYSYRWCIVHFWAFLLITIWAGPHHLHYTALPEWASSLGMIFGVLLWLPCMLGLLNALLTLRGAKPTDETSRSVLGYFYVALTFFGIATFEGPLLSIKSFNALTHFTDWTVAHAHSSSMGWCGFLLFGMIYWLVPKLFQTQLWSAKLVRVHFWLALLGVLVCVLPSYAAGICQSVMLLSLDDLGNLNTPEFIESIPAVRPLWWASMLGGVIYTVGLATLGLNLVVTWMKRPAEYQKPLITATARDKNIETDNKPEYDGRYGGDVPVLQLARKLEMASKFSWHLVWERLPSKMTFVITFVVVAASVLEVVPMFAIRANVTKIPTVRPYTPLELYGRQLFIQEGCFNCHSQMIRPLVAETKRYGEFSRSGEFVHDRPFQWGSRRIGPDLARVGGKYESFWHWEHLDAPESKTEGSVMPSFSHLLDSELDYDQVSIHVQALAGLDASYTAEEVENAGTAARLQAESIAAEIVAGGGPAAMYDRQAIALIAYLQRLGTDLNRAENPEAQESSDNEAASP